MAFLYVCIRIHNEYKHGSKKKKKWIKVQKIRKLMDTNRFKIIVYEIWLRKMAPGYVNTIKKV